MQPFTIQAPGYASVPPPASQATTQVLNPQAPAFNPLDVTTAMIKEIMLENTKQQERLLDSHNKYQEKILDTFVSKQNKRYREKED